MKLISELAKNYDWVLNAKTAVLSQKLDAPCQELKGIIEKVGRLEHARSFEVSDGCVKSVLISLLKFYKLAISPLLPPSCRFIPTCSEYAVDAISRYGACAGAAWRCGECSVVTHSIRVDTIRLSRRRLVTTSTTDATKTTFTRITTLLSNSVSVEYSFPDSASRQIKIRQRHLRPQLAQQQLQQQVQLRQAAPAAPLPVPNVTAAPQRTITIRTPLYDAKFDTLGAEPISWIIKKNKNSGAEIFSVAGNKKDRIPLELISPEGLKRQPRMVPLQLQTGDSALDASAEFLDVQSRRCRFTGR